ncbi:MAG: FAD-dependent oxidoreductase [Methylococcales bacterium]|nr:FAD-dependent oxidoreductase [Methylococcales bacterium]
MSVTKTKLSGPDLPSGIALSAIPDGTLLLGHAQGEPVLLARKGDELFATGNICTHYHAPLNEGLLVNDTVRCPWHHACFSLRTGEALRAPALDPLPCWRVEQKDGNVYVLEKLEPEIKQLSSILKIPESVVIIGGGAAGNVAAETLRREGYSGPITLFSADVSVPYDRPKLSKSYLAGVTPPESNPLRSFGFYQQHNIDLKLNARVAKIDTVNQNVQLIDGGKQSYDSLLLATGAEPVKLDVPGAGLPHVFYLRTLADSRALIARALAAQRVVIIGASFIGLEVAASLSMRNLEVHVVAPGSSPMEKILGIEVGTFIRKLHEQHGVKFHLGAKAASIDEHNVILTNGHILPADFVVAGIGVKPSISLAEKAGIILDRGVKVNEYLETSIPGIFAAGDIARWPDRLTGEGIRVEHWVVAQRQGRTAARNILGGRERFDAVPFFWTRQYDLGISYIGHAEQWDHVEIDGQLDARNCTITYRRGGKKLAVAVINRSIAGLRAEVEFERKINLLE